MNSEKIKNFFQKLTNKNVMFVHLCIHIGVENNSGKHPWKKQLQEFGSLGNNTHNK